MLSAEECIAQARGLSDKASEFPLLSGEFLYLAGYWLDLSRVAEWQDEQMAVFHQAGSRPPRANLL